jgi:hypothetical protein
MRAIGKKLYFAISYEAVALATVEWRLTLIGESFFEITPTIVETGTGYIVTAPDQYRWIECRLVIVTVESPRGVFVALADMYGVILLASGAEKSYLAVFEDS